MGGGIIVAPLGMAYLAIHLLSVLLMGRVPHQWHKVFFTTVHAGKDELFTMDIHIGQGWSRFGG